MATNQYVATWRAGQQVREDLYGADMTITIGSTTLDADLGQATMDEIIVAGGTLEKGVQKITCAMADCPGGTEPAKFTSVTTSKGFTGKVLGGLVNENDILTFFIGEPLATDRRSPLL